MSRPTAPMPGEFDALIAKVRAANLAAIRAAERQAAHKAADDGIAAIRAKAEMLLAGVRRPSNGARKRAFRAACLQANGEAPTGSTGAERYPGRATSPSRSRPV